MVFRPFRSFPLLGQGLGRGRNRHNLEKTIVRNGKEYTYWEGRCTVGCDPGTGKQIQRSVSGNCSVPHAKDNLSYQTKNSNRTVLELGALLAGKIRQRLEVNRAPGWVYKRGDTRCNGVDSIVGNTARWLKYSLSFSGDVAQVHISIYM